MCTGLIRLRLASAALSGLLAASPTFAQSVQYFYDAAAWDGAVSNPGVVATFSEALWPVNQPLPGDWTLNGVTYSGHAGTPFPNIFVFNPSPLTGPALTANGDEDIDLVLGPPRSAFGFDVSVNAFGPVSVSVYDAGGQQIGFTSAPAGTNGFLGVISPVPIARVNFRSVNGAQQNSLLDTVRLADACLAITSQPASVGSCAALGADFSVAASGPGPLTYRWQIELSPGNWATLGNDPMPLPCGGNSSHAFAQPFDGATSHITIFGCPGPFRVRAVVSNACGSVASEPATFTFCVADFNCSGGTPDDADVAAFFEAWNNGDESADVNGSGGTPDDADIAYFFQRWNEGC